MLCSSMTGVSAFRSTMGTRGLSITRRSPSIMPSTRVVGASGAQVRMMANAPKLTTPSDLLDDVDVFIFDCDGVIWKGDSLIDGVPAILDKLRGERGLAHQPRAASTPSHHTVATLPHHTASPHRTAMSC